MNKTYSIIINDNVYLVKLIERKMKNIRLKVDNDQIIVSGYHITREKSDSIIQRNYDWLVKKLDEFSHRKSIFQLEEIEEFKKVYLYGDLKDIYFLSNSQYRVDDVTFYITKIVNNISDLRNIELKKIRAKFLKQLQDRFDYWCFVFNKKPLVFYKDMKSKYGYCKYKENTIVLSTRLVHLPLYLIDYVIVHEFCHFDVPNHSKCFYALVFKYFPNYRNAIKTLKEYSVICK